MAVWFMRSLSLVYSRLRGKVDCLTEAMLVYWRSGVWGAVRELGSRGEVALGLALCEIRMLMYFSRSERYS